MKTILARDLQRGMKFFAHGWHVAYNLNDSGRKGETMVVVFDDRAKTIAQFNPDDEVLVK